MAGNQFSIGRDGAQITIMGASGPMSFNILTEFDSKPQYKDLKVEGIDGITRSRHLPNGHTGTLMFDRADSGVSDYFAQQEANFFAGLSPDQVTITQTITEANGSVSQYQYTQVDLWEDDDGTWKGLDKVPQRVNFYSARKIKVS